MFRYQPRTLSLPERQRGFSRNCIRKSCRTLQALPLALPQHLKPCRERIPWWEVLPLDLRVGERRVSRRGSLGSQPAAGRPEDHPPPPAVPGPSHLLSWAWPDSLKHPGSASPGRLFPGDRESEEGALGPAALCLCLLPLAQLHSAGGRGGLPSSHRLAGTETVGRGSCLRRPKIGTGG